MKALDDSVDYEALLAAFVDAAASYSERKGYLLQRVEGSGGGAGRLEDGRYPSDSTYLGGRDLLSLAEHRDRTGACRELAGGLSLPGRY